MRKAVKTSNPCSCRKREMDFLQQHGDRLQQYKGEWIAVDGDELVAHASTLDEVLRLAKELGHPHPLITAVPKEPNSIFAF